MSNEEFEYQKQKQQTNTNLDGLVASKDILSYQYTQNFPEHDREILTTETLTITFPSGNTLKLETFSSGCMENTGLQIDVTVKE